MIRASVQRDRIGTIIQRGQTTAVNPSSESSLRASVDGGLSNDSTEALRRRS
jgi:hypothetical protein